jgi:hypothetical protein
MFYLITTSVRGAGIEKTLPPPVRLKDRFHHALLLLRQVQQRPHPFALERQVFEVRVRLGT